MDIESITLRLGWFNLPGPGHVDSIWPIAEARGRLTLGRWLWYLFEHDVEAGTVLALFVNTEDQLDNQVGTMTVADLYALRAQADEDYTPRWIDCSDPTQPRFGSPPPVRHDLVGRHFYLKRCLHRVVRVEDGTCHCEWIRTGEMVEVLTTDVLARRAQSPDAPVYKHALPRWPRRRPLTMKIEVRVSTADRADLAWWRIEPFVLLVTDVEDAYRMAAMFLQMKGARVVRWEAVADREPHYVRPGDRLPLL